MINEYYITALRATHVSHLNLFESGEEVCKPLDLRKRLRIWKFGSLEGDSTNSTEHYP